MQMLSGGTALVLLSAGVGELTAFSLDDVSLAAVLSFAYLAFAGGAVAFTSYVWLLERMSAPIVATYTFVNPVIAVILGWAVLGERITAIASVGAALIIGSFIGYLVGAWLADRIGRRNLFLTFSIGAIAVILLYTQLPLTNEVLWLLGFPLGFFASGYFSGVGAFLTELYPTRLRGSGQGFCYNFGRGIGALFPFLVGALSNTTSLGNAIAIFAVLAYGVFFIAAFALPETRGRVLHADT
jgi:MFS family permease